MCIRDSSKTVGVDETVAAIQTGYRHFAENRPQELVRKLAGLAEHPDCLLYTSRCV